MNTFTQIPNTAALDFTNETPEVGDTEAFVDKLSSMQAKLQAWANSLHTAIESINTLGAELADAELTAAIDIEALQVSVDAISTLSGSSLDELQAIAAHIDTLVATANGVVSVAGAQSITGAKTFTDHVNIVNPTTSATLRIDSPSAGNPQVLFYRLGKLVSSALVTSSKLMKRFYHAGGFTESALHDYGVSLNTPTGQNPSVYIGQNYVGFFALLASSNGATLRRIDSVNQNHTDIQMLSASVEVNRLLRTKNVDNSCSLELNPGAWPTLMIKRGSQEMRAQVEVSRATIRYTHANAIASEIELTDEHLQFGIGSNTLFSAGVSANLANQLKVHGNVDKGGELTLCERIGFGANELGLRAPNNLTDSYTVIFPKDLPTAPDQPLAVESIDSTNKLVYLKFG